MWDYFGHTEDTKVVELRNLRIELNIKMLEREEAKHIWQHKKAAVFKLQQDEKRLMNVIENKNKTDK